MRSISSGSPTLRSSATARPADDASAAKAFETSLRNAGREESWAGSSAPGRDAGLAAPIQSEIEALRAQLGFGASVPRPLPVASEPAAYTICGPIPLPGAPAPLPGPVTRIEAPAAVAAIWLGALQDA